MEGESLEDLGHVLDIDGFELVIGVVHMSKHALIEYEHEYAQAAPTTNSKWKHWSANPRRSDQFCICY